MNERLMQSIEDLENLFINNRDLDIIRTYLGRFNPIKTMGMERMEIRHSSILAWLLSPQETHGLGDYFLKAFLAEARRGQIEGPKALEIFQANLLDCEIRREWKNIDLLILCPSNRWIFIIENKFDSRQHNGQLKKYMESIETEFKKEIEEYGWSVKAIFLSLWEEKPEDERYTSIEYTQIYELLDSIVSSNRFSLSNEVSVFIRHYYEIIMEVTGMSDELKNMEKLARELYQNNRKALDFIFEHGKRTEFTIACDNLFGEAGSTLKDIKVEERSYMLNASDSRIVSFLPKSWFDSFNQDEISWSGCEKWWAGYPVIMWIQIIPKNDNSHGQIRLYAEVGPLNDHDLRLKIISAITQAGENFNPKRISFQRNATEKGTKYSKFFKNNSYRIDDVHDHEKITEAMRKALRDFHKEIEVIGEALAANFTKIKSLN